MIDLQPFCTDTANHPSQWGQGVAQPFSYGAFTYAVMNGHIIVRIPRVDGVAVFDNCGLTEGVVRNLAGVEDLTFEPLPPFEQFSPPAIPAKPCGTCKGTGALKKCLSCDGRGERECGECGHECACDRCDGYGEVSSAKGDVGAEDCGECEGSGNETPSVSLRAARFVQHDINGDYVALIQTLPGVQWCFTRHSFEPVPFKFDGGGYGMVMPLRMRPGEATKVEAPAPASVA